MESKLRRILRNKHLQCYCLIMLGTTLLALGINLYYQPQMLVTGGATGLGIIIQHFSQQMFGYKIPLWLTNLLINAPLLFIASRVKGKAFIAKTLFATLFLSAALFVTAYIPIEYFKGDMLLSAVFGGALSGIGIGIVFRNMATTGGSDLAASIIHHYRRDISLSKLMFILDTAVIILGFFIFEPERSMYAIIAVFVSSKAIDAILEGLYFAKAAFIISSKTEEVSACLLKDLDRGATSLSGKGLYTGEDKDVIMCVVSNKEIGRLKELVAGADKNAFVIVADVREVLGNGFQSF